MLRQYLNAWLPIMTRSNDRILFIDAFAGPGRYASGEEGSPLVALNTYLSHSNLPSADGGIDFFFIEKDPARADHLRQVLAPKSSEVPSDCGISVITGAFTDRMTEALDAINLQNKELAPAFVMLDPFGVSDTPMDLIARILQNEKSEVYVSFMSRDINRFNTVPEYEEALNSLFGCEDWKSAWALDNGPDKIKFFYQLYTDQLKASGAEYVLRFDLYENESLVYALFFATKNDLGCDKMKQAMWRVAPFGDFRFKSATRDQMILDEGFTDLRALDDALVGNFGMNVSISIESLERFMRSDETLFHSGQLRSRLAEMENDGRLVVQDSPRQRRVGYPHGTAIRFKDPPPPGPQQTRFI